MLVLPRSPSGAAAALLRGPALRTAAPFFPALTPFSCKLKPTSGCRVSRHNAPALVPESPRLKSRRVTNASDRERQPLGKVCGAEWASLGELQECTGPAAI